MREIRIVVFKGSDEKEAEAKVMAAVKKCEAVLKDFYEKDYGVVGIFECAYDKVAHLESLVGNIHGATYSPY